MNYYLGIDLGTSSVKFLVINESKTIVNSHSKEYAISMPKPDWREIEPDIWYQSVVSGLKELFSIMPDGVIEKINGIGITGQMHTTVFLDKDGNSIRPAIMWNDNRTSSCIPALKEQIYASSDITHIAAIISPGSPAANLYWLKSNEPGNFERLKTFLIAPDYIVYRLTGRYSTDYCEASTSSLYDLYHDSWSPDMRKLLDLPLDSYPPIKGSNTIAGTLLPAIAKELNLDHNVKVIVGTGDNPAAGIANGCLLDQQPVLSIGTSGIVMSTRNQIDFTKKGKNIRFSLDGETIFTMVQGAVQSAGSSLNWLVNDILKVNSFDINVIPSTLNIFYKKNIFFYPHLVGDKTIYANPKLRGAFIGISTDTTRTDMQIAVMEGICFAFHELIDAMGVHLDTSIGLKVTGGGARSTFWMQLLANILGVKIQPLGDNAGACYGIALLARAGCSHDKLLGESSDWSNQNCILPDTSRKTLYESRYLMYKKIYSALELIDS